MAEKPERVRNLFPNIMNFSGYQPQGIYAMTIYTLGIPFTQIVDDFLPLKQNGDTLFNGFGKDGSFWGAVVEKAMAKWWGNYEHTVGGYMDQAVSALNGSPAEWINNNNADQVWNFIRSADEDNDIITAGSPGCGPNGD